MKAGDPRMRPAAGQNNSMFRARIKAIGEHLNTGYEYSKNLRHRGTMGSAREALVSDFLSELLPKRYGIQSGVGVEAGGQQSRQTDIIVIDTLLAPLISGTHNFSVVPREACLLTVSVKSTLGKGAMKDFANAITHFNRLRVNEKPYIQFGRDGETKVRHPQFPTRHALFAFSGPKRSATVKRLLQGSICGTGGEGVTVCLLNVGCFYCFPNGSSAKIIEFERNGLSAELGWFITSLSYSLRGATAGRGDFDPSEYLK